MARYVTLLINNEAMALEKKSIIAIEPHTGGTRIIVKDDKPGKKTEYFTRTNYDYVVEAYQS
jgi:hypothetical protein